MFQNIQKMSKICLKNSKMSKNNSTIANISQKYLSKIRYLVNGAAWERPMVRNEKIIFFYYRKINYKSIIINRY